LIVLFEPWNLGDALIAASVARVSPDRLVLACNSRWHEVLQLASNNSLNLISLDLPYVWRSEKKYFSLGDAASLKKKFPPAQQGDMKVISIRGDVRDWIAARRIFSGAFFSFNGWLQFCARKSSLLDLPFRHGFVAVRNRYKSWADATGIPFGTVEQMFALHLEKPADSPILIHVGVQWRSKQYPHVAQLAELLRRAGNHVDILAGPDDPLPDGIAESSVFRPKWHELVARIRNAGCVISNDSGAMHLAAYLGCRTLALSRCSNISEWLPPGVTALSSPSAPHGYRPVPDYWSDHILPDWPLPDEVVGSLSP
jgi:hypothetical protein